MATWRGYWALEDLNLTGGQRQTLRNGILQYYQDNQAPTNLPHEMLHWRLSNDGTKAIFEAKFDEDHLTPSRFKAFLGNVFSIDPETINHTNSSITLDKYNTPVVTFSRGGTNYIRVALFGGVGGTWEVSHEPVQAYLNANRGEWDTARD